MEQMTQQGLFNPNEFYSGIDTYLSGLHLPFPPEKLGMDEADLEVSSAKPLWSAARTPGSAALQCHLLGEAVPGPPPALPPTSTSSLELKNTAKLLVLFHFLAGHQISLRKIRRMPESQAEKFNQMVKLRLRFKLAIPEARLTHAAPSLERAVKRGFAN